MSTVPAVPFNGEGGVCNDGARPPPAACGPPASAGDMAGHHGGGKEWVVGHAGRLDNDGNDGGGGRTGEGVLLGAVSGHRLQREDALTAAAVWAPQGGEGRAQGAGGYAAMTSTSSMLRRRR